jgi:gamma-glutamylputrescine oxidase
VSGLVPFSSTSFWLEGVAQGRAPMRRLEGHHEFDAVVIGGGFTGLSAAIALKQAGLSVAVVEREHTGFGASGRNCGQVGVQLGTSPIKTLKQHGLERTQQLANVLKSAIVSVQRHIDISGVPCDYVNNGNITTAVHKDQIDRINKTADILNAVGLRSNVLDKGALRDRGIPPSMVHGFHEEIGGTINPAKYALCLHKRAELLDIPIFEDSPVQHIKPGKRVHVTAPLGSTSSASCVLATNAYSGELGLLNSAILPLSVSAIVTAVLTREQRSRLEWPGEEGLHTTHRLIENIRFTPDGRILIGTKRARCGFGLHHPPSNDQQLFAELEQVLRERLPQLKDVKVEHGWTGRIAVSSDFLPNVGHLGESKNIVYSVGYGGHGIAMASECGAIAAGLLLDRDPGDAAVLINRQKLPIPPEPFRYAGARLMLASMAASDRQIDAKARMAVVHL